MWSKGQVARIKMLLGFYTFSSLVTHLLLQETHFLSIGSTHHIYDYSISNILLWSIKQVLWHITHSPENRKKTFPAPLRSSLVQYLPHSLIASLPSCATSQLKLNCSTFKTKSGTSGFVPVLTLLNTITFLFKAPPRSFFTLPCQQSLSIKVLSVLSGQYWMPQERLQNFHYCVIIPLKGGLFLVTGC